MKLGSGVKWPTWGVTHWPTGLPPPDRRRRASGGKFARRGFMAGCSDRPWSSDHHVWERGQGYASLTVGKGGSGGKTLCLWLLGRDCLVWMTGWRLIWYSRGRARLAARSHFQLTTSRGLLGEKRWENLPEGGSRLWPQLYGGGDGWCQGRGIATDGNVALSGAFPGSSRKLMTWNLNVVHPRPQVSGASATKTLRKKA